MHSNGCPVPLYTVSSSAPSISFSPIIPITLLSGAISICPPHFLLSLSISSCFSVCVFCVVDFTHRRGSLHVHVNVLQHTGVSVIECPCCWQASVPPHIPVVYVVFPADPCFPPLLLTPLIYHSSSIFYLFCSISLPSPLSSISYFLSSPLLLASFLSSYYSPFPSVIPHLSLVYTALSFPPLLVDLFLWFHISFHVFFHPIFTLLPPVYFLPLSLPPSLVSAVLVLPPLLHLISLSLLCPDLFLQVFLHFLLFSPPLSNFYTLVLSFPVFPPSPFHLFEHLLYTPLLTSFPSLILPPFIASVEIFSLFITS